VVQKRRARRHRRRLNQAEADQLAAECEASGLTREAFCLQRDVALSTLCRYLTRYRRQKADTMASPRFVQVEVTAPTSGSSTLTVLLRGGRRIEVSSGFDTGTLRELLSVLEYA
jgi:hypothetical protein